MNSGTQGLTPEQQTQQRLAGEEMASYWKLQAPALGAALTDANQNEGAREEAAAGGAAGGVFSRTTDLARRTAGGLSARGSGAGGGNAVSREGDALTAGTQAAAATTAGARGEARTNQIQQVQGLGVIGQGLVNRVNTAANTSADTSAQIAAQRTASRQANNQQVASAAALALMLA